MTRLETWLEEEVALLREYDPDMTEQRESEYREALGKTLHAEQLRVADAFGDLGDVALAEMKKVSDRARDLGLRAFFRRFW